MKQPTSSPRASTIARQSYALHLDLNKYASISFVTGHDVGALNWSLVKEVIIWRYTLSAIYSPHRAVIQVRTAILLPR